jgi:flavin reductase (DIM6/NTAB) family NADH-FMN oxidoreductase RutF
MTRVVVTTTDPAGWWWAGAGVLAPTDDSLVAVVLPAFVATQRFAVHLLTPSQTALAERFARDPYDFDGLGVAHGFGGVPLLTAVPERLYCGVVRTIGTSDGIRVYGIPASALTRAA